VGPQGVAGPTGPIGPEGQVEVYEQPNDPGAVEIGALWVDTDEGAPLNLSDAPIDGQQYARKDAAWSVVTGGSGGGGISQADADVRYVNTTGDEMTGNLSVSSGDYGGVFWKNIAGYTRFMRTNPGATPSLSLINAAATVATHIFGDDGTFTISGALRMAPRATPVDPIDGEMWMTEAGLFIRINGVTKQVALT
jgi:hypothetical protein